MTTDERLPSAEEFFTKRGASAERERILGIIKEYRQVWASANPSLHNSRDLLLDRLREEIEKEAMK